MGHVMCIIDVVGVALQAATMMMSRVDVAFLWVAVLLLAGLHGKRSPPLTDTSRLRMLQGQRQAPLPPDGAAAPAPRISSTGCPVARASLLAESSAQLQKPQCCA